VALAIVVALSFTGVGDAGATTLTGIDVSATGMAGALHTAVAAGFNLLITQAGIQIVTNGGDLGAARGGGRLVYSNDDLIYKAIDHYKTFEMIN